MSPARLPKTRGHDAAEEAADSAEVPAAVVCVLCGRNDCPGCVEDPLSASGVMAIVPWERAALRWTARFWATVQATTRGAEGFFSALPDGRVAPAFRFALLAETFAVASTAAFITPLVILAVPGLLLRFFASGPTREAVALSALVGVLGFTVLLVGAHAVYGISFGGAASRPRALRFGLYACGWDFGSSPAGVLTALFCGGWTGAVSLTTSSITAPSRALDAAIGGVFQLQGAPARKAKRRAMVIATSLAVPAVVVVLAAIVLTALFAV